MEYFPTSEDSEVSKERTMIWREGNGESKGWIKDLIFRGIMLIDKMCAFNQITLCFVKLDICS